VPAADAALEAISATGPTVSRNPARVKQEVTASLTDLKATLRPDLGSAQLIGWNEGPAFAFDWGSFSRSTGPTAQGSFAAPGVHTIAVTVSVSGMADYSCVDDAGKLDMETRPVAGRRTFQVNVLVQEPEDVAVLVSAPRLVSVNQRDIPISAAVFRGGEPVRDARVVFASDALRVPPTALETDADGLATATADAGPMPSLFRNGSHVTASVQHKTLGKASGTARLTVVRVNDPTPAHPRILVGSLSHNELYSVVLTFTVLPQMGGVPVTFAFAPGDGEGVNYPAKLEEASATTDASGRARVRLRSSDLRESPTVLCRFGASAGSTTVTFEGITGVRMVIEK